MPSIASTLFFAACFFAENSCARLFSEGRSPLTTLWRAEEGGERAKGKGERAKGKPFAAYSSSARTSLEVQGGGAQADGGVAYEGATVLEPKQGYYEQARPRTKRHRNSRS